MAVLKRITQLPASVQAVLNASISAASYSRRDFSRYDQADVPHVACRIATEAAILPGPMTEADMAYFPTEEMIESIDLWVNPSQTAWSVPLREASQKTKGGSVRYSWPRQGKHKSHRYFDIFNVDFTFQTGSIFTDPVGENQGRTPPGLYDFYQFIQLLNTPRKLPNGQPNWHVVQYTSRIFPRITLRGWFAPEGPSFPDSAEGGFGLQWTIRMEVHQSTPPLWNLKELAAVFGTMR